MISFGFFVDWQLGIAILWLLYRAALADRIPAAAGRGYLLAIAPVAAGVAGYKIEVLHAVLATPATAVGFVGENTVATATTWFDWVLLYNIVVVLLSAVWLSGAVDWIVRWRKGEPYQEVRLCGTMRGGVASSLFSRIAINASMRSSNHLKVLLAHERAHVHYGHSWDMLYLCILRSVLWINPAVWFLARDLVRVHEAQADRAAIGSSPSTRHYIDMLLGAQIGSAGTADPKRLTTVHYFSYLSIKNRIKMMTRNVPSRRSLWRLSAALPVVGAMLLLFSFSSTPVLIDTELTVPKTEIPTTQAQAGQEEPTFEAEVLPKFQGKDLNAFRSWVMTRITYPKEVAEQGIQGRVYLSFVIEKDGSVTNVQVARGVNPKLDAIAVKVIQSSPKWSPGLTKNKPIRIRYNIPIDFVLPK